MTGYCLHWWNRNNMKYFTVEHDYDAYLNEELYTMTLFNNSGVREFVECTDDVSATLAINELVQNGYTIRGIA